MEIQVVEGKLVEVPANDGTGVDRRAFGEFVGPHGELASYAFGWATGADRHVAHLSVGIGAGVPGGGTFHALTFDNDDGYAYSLTDEPFERVPQGGLDLTADQARAHEDLPFIWWVTDQFMQHDRRAWWMRHWLLGTACIQTREIFERSEPVQFVSHDADDDRTLLDVLGLPPGGTATRPGIGAPWEFDA